MTKMSSTDEKPVKKGKPSWSFANKLDVKSKDPNFRYRWIDTDDANLDKKLEEGWRLVNKVTGIPGEHVDPQVLGQGTALTTSKTYRGLVLAALPTELAEARAEAISERTQLQMSGIKNRVRQRVAQEHGSEAAEAIYAKRGHTIIE